MSIILGVTAFHAGSAAAVIIDGQPIVAIAEERLNRIKYYSGFPRLAICKCLEITGVRFEEVDAVAIGRDASANVREKIRYALQHPGQLFNFLKIKASKKPFGSLKELFAQELDVVPDCLKFKFHHVEHHVSHIASAYFISKWDKAAALSIDTSGDFVTSMMADCEGDEIKVKKRVYVPDSLGSLYTMICQFIGYCGYGDEGKVMGLASLGKDTYVDEIEKMVVLEEDGFRLDPRYFLPIGPNQVDPITGEVLVPRHYSDKMIRLFGEPRRPKAELTQREMDLAYGLQRIFEKAYMHLLNILYRKVPVDRLVMAGGCVLNSVANGKIFDHTPFTQTCIQPGAGDEGHAVGAALFVSNSVLKEGRRHVMKNAYLGPEYSETEIQAELQKKNVPFKKLDRKTLLEETADRIAEGKVVGWFQGRMEWGPRALGNRSILAHPGLPTMKDTLNARIKRRESFRPFAPVVLEDRQAEIFEHTHPSPFMLHVYKIKAEWRRRLVAVNHVDNTGRLQTVARDENSLYYDLIGAFEKRTGIPVLLNTSFNENEPIVCAPSEAIECFLRTKMDTLVIGPFVCHKNGVAA